MRFLIVDDDTHFVRILGRLLAARGHEAVGRTDPFDAAALLEEWSFDAILCDVHLGAVHGSEFHALVCERAPYQASRIVFTSGGLHRAEDEELALHHEVLLKPFPVETAIRVAADRNRTSDTIPVGVARQASRPRSLRPT